MSWTRPPCFDGEGASPAPSPSPSPTPPEQSAEPVRGQRKRSAGRPSAATTTVLESVQEEDAADVSADVADASGDAPGEDGAGAAYATDVIPEESGEDDDGGGTGPAPRDDDEADRAPAPAPSAPVPPSRAPRPATPEDLPFDERPFDEVAEDDSAAGPARTAGPGDRRVARFGSGVRSPAVMNSLALDAVERVDSFSDRVPPVEPLYGVKSYRSLRSIDFHGARTFGTQATDTTRRIANTGGGVFDVDDRDSSFMSEGGLSDVPEVPPGGRGRRGGPAGRDAKVAEDLGDGSTTDGGSTRVSYDDGVSTLSGIGNDSLEGRRRRDWGRAAGSGPGPGAARPPPPPPPASGGGGWTQEELDDFIARNDWGSVARYINEMRAGRERDARRPAVGGAGAPPRSAGRPDRLDGNASTSSQGGESGDLWQSVCSRDEGSEQAGGDRRSGPPPREAML